MDPNVCLEFPNLMKVSHSVLPE